MAKPANVSQREEGQRVAGALQAILSSVGMCLDAFLFGGTERVSVRHILRIVKRGRLNFQTFIPHIEIAYHGPALVVGAGDTGSTRVVRLGAIPLHNIDICIVRTFPGMRLPRLWW